MVADESCLKLMECYTSYVEGLTDTMSPSALFTAETHYQKKVEALLNDENCYKVVMVIIPSLGVLSVVLVHVCMIEKPILRYII